MNIPQYFHRRIQTEYYLEIFLITAVCAILVIRFFLKLAGYPILGTETLHIAHMFWGGLLMAAAVIMAFSFIGRRNLIWVAALGGVGFGTFIDEIGKFVTHDNDYFFQPAVALMYLCLVLIFLGVKSVIHRTDILPSEYLLNAMESLEEAAFDDMDEVEKATILNYLRRADPDHPLVNSLTRMIVNVVPVPVGPGHRLVRFRHRFQQIYGRIVNLPGFSSGLIALFGFQLMMMFLVTLTLIFFYGFGMEQVVDVRIFSRVADKVQHLSVVDVLYLISSGLSAIFILLGMMRLRRSRLPAYRMFERSILITIFVSQLLAFYKEQFSALAGLFFNIMLWAGLQFLIQQELLYRNRSRDDTGAT